ncbi:MAG: fibronectin type III domain-containing protein [Bacteroidales bacterium]|nr:fibronectin type III domain-containing protein [Bacteroidales bacterium]
MKTLYKLSLVALNVLALVSCAKEPETSPAERQNELHFVIRTSESNTKSYIENNLDGTYTPKWSEGDKLAMFIGDISSNTKPAAIFSATVSGNGAKATFEGTVNNVAEEGTFKSFAPADAFETAYSNGTVGITLNAIQKPSSLTFDEACDILVAKPCFYMASDEEVLIDGLYFKRMFSVLKINLKGVEALNGETVKSFTVTASDATLTGRAAIDLSSASISQWNVKNNSVKALYGNDAPVFGGEDGLENTIWLVVNPTTAAAGSKLIFNAETEKYSIEKEVTLTSDLTFPESQIAVINISVNESDYSAVTSEDRIFVEKFTNVTESKKTYQPSETGAIGTGVTSELNYVYTGNNTNIRLNSNGHSSTDPYLYISDKGEFAINNLKVKNESSLKFSCQARSNSGTAEVSIQYKESSSEIWNIAGKFTATTSSFDNVQSTIFTINSTTSSIDLKISGNAVLVDDLVIESYIENRTALSVPGNVKATVDAETSNKIKVEWNIVDNAGSYVVTATPADGEPVSKEVTETSCTFEGLAYETAYTVSVYAKPSDANLYRDSEVAEVSVDTGEKPADMPNITIDIIDQTFTGKTTTSYSDFTDKVGLSGAIYAGNCAGGNKSVQLRSDKNSSGIVVTKSAGKATKIAVKWNSNTASGRILDVYGKSSAYTSASDLYNTSTQGTKIGSIVYGTSTELIIEGDYTYIGLRSNSGAMYLESISITWDTDGDSSDTPKELTSLSWTGYKDTYTVGSTFSVDGTIKAIYSDNSEKTLSAEDVQIETEPDLSKAGTTTAKISYTEGDITVSAEAAITVKEASQGGESKTYTLQFGADYNSKSVSSYTASWTVTCDNFTWDMTNWNNNNNGWNYVKCGSKSATSVATITTSASIPEAISKVIVTIDAVKADNVNSIKLLVASDKEFTENLQEIPVTEIQTGEISLNISTPTENCFYQLAFDCKKSSSNGIVQVSKIVYTNE